MKNRRFKSKVFKNFSYQIVGQLTSRLFSFIFIIYAARVLEPTKFGFFSFALSLGYLALSVMDFGLDSLAIKGVVRGDEDYYKKIILIKRKTILFGFLLLVVTSLKWGNRERLAVVILSFGFASLSGLNLIYSFFRGIEMMQWEAVCLFGQKLLLILFGVLFLNLYPSVLSATVAFSISAIGFLCFSNLLLSRKFNFSIFSNQFLPNFNYLDIFRDALPLAIVGFLWVLYYRVDAIMLGTMKNMSSVGIYSGAFRIVEGLILFAAVIMIVQFPGLSKIGCLADKSIFFQRIRNLGFYLVLLSMAVFFVAFFSASKLFKSILGSGYDESTAVFKVLIFALFAIYPGQLVTQALIALDLHRSYMFIALACTTMNILLNFLLIPLHGAFGAAWATVLTEIAMTLLCTAVLFKVYRREKLEQC